MTRVLDVGSETEEHVVELEQIDLSEEVQTVDEAVALGVEQGMSLMEVMAMAMAVPVAAPVVTAAVAATQLLPMPVTPPLAPTPPQVCKEGATINLDGPTGPEVLVDDEGFTLLGPMG